MTADDWTILGERLIVAAAYAFCAWLVVAAVAGWLA
jgi:hypothetical protein